MKRLDEIKARGELVAAKPDNREATYTEFAALIRLANFDVPALVAAVEAVLELHALGIGDLFTAEGIEARLAHCVECTQVEHKFVVRYPCPTVVAIRTALGEGEK